MKQEDLAKMEKEIQDLESGLIERQKKQRQPGDPESVSDMREVLKIQEQIRGLKERLDLERAIEEQGAKEAPVDDSMKKTSPIEVALTKIGEAMNEPLNKVDQRLENANEKLIALEERQRTGNGLPGDEYNVLRESLNREIDAYESLLRGEKPDLSWAKQEKPITLDDNTLPKEEPFEIVDTPLVNKEVPTGNEVATLVRDLKNMGEVFDTLIKNDVGTKGQKQLLAILNRVPHIRSALFKFGTAFEKDGKWSRGAVS